MPDLRGRSRPQGRPEQLRAVISASEYSPDPRGWRTPRDPLKEALTALADALAKRPAEEILFDWFRSGRLVGELSVLIKRRHPDVQARIDEVYQEHLAKLGKKRRDRGSQDD